MQKNVQTNRYLLGRGGVNLLTSWNIIALGLASLEVSSSVLSVVILFSQDSSSADDKTVSRY